VSRRGAVIFDLDGTLVDSYRPITTALNAAREAFDLPPVALEDVRREVGRGLESLIEEHLGAARVGAGVAIFRSVYARVFADGTVPLPGAGEVPRELARRGRLLAVVSNKPARFGRPIVELVGLGDVVRVVLGPDCGLPPKPDPAMLLRAAELLAVESAQCVYIGDMPIDAVAARAAGMACVLTPTGGCGRAELERCSGVRVVSDLFEIVEIFA
jgi:phosphoglycolate phosphatase